MAIELTRGSIKDLCNGINVQPPIVLQFMGYEAIDLKNFDRYYRLVLSDSVNMNSYFFLDSSLHYLMDQKQLNYGTIIQIDKFKFMDGENCTDHSLRWIIFIEKITILVQRQIFGNPQPLINVKQVKKSLVNLNSKEYSCRVFHSFEQLEQNLKNIEEVKNLPSGKCSFIFKLTLIKKRPILTFSNCRVLNMKMEDSTSVINVSAFNSLSDHIDKILKENKTYYITDTYWKQKQLDSELKLQPYSVIIESVNQTRQNVQSIKTSNFNTLLQNNPNTFCDLIGLCIEVGDIEICSQQTLQTEIAKRDIVLMDSSMTKITLKVWGEYVNKFNNNFKCPPVVMVKNVILKEFNGIKHFSMVKLSMLSVNPNTDEARELEEWYTDMVTTMEDS